tara:strand:+ start:462 stop:1301 length:840 start_codon:yes stop_codon:yes gene_type:complete
MKLKHNKKRNTAFLYEALVRELTKSVIKKDYQRKEKVLSIIKEHFPAGSPLNRELKVFDALKDSGGLKRGLAEKLILEAKMLHKGLDSARVYKEQTKLINKINKELDSSVFSNFVPNYKYLATIDRILDQGTTLKDRVILEDRLAGLLSSENPQTAQMKPIDNLVYGKFVEKFNNKYSNEDNLHQEQKYLLNHYITSFADNGIKFKIFLNEELGRLKYEVEQILSLEEVKEDPIIMEKTQEVLSVLGSFSDRSIDAVAIKDILRIQSLVREAKSDANSD